MKKRFQAFFSGMVQGVGFRFTTERIARQHDVTGFVRNLSNGEVELVAEGQELVLKEFLTAVREGPLKNYIRDVRVDWTEAQSQYQTFSITY